MDPLFPLSQGHHRQAAKSYRRSITASPTSRIDEKSDKREGESSRKMFSAGCARISLKLLSLLNVGLLLLGFVVLDYALYLIHAHSFVVSYACGTLLLSGSTLLVFATAFACGGKRVSAFLVAYATVLFMLLLSQAALLKVYARKESREWLLQNAATHQIVDIVEHRQHLLHKLFTALIALEVVSCVLLLCLARCPRHRLRSQNKYEYRLDEDFDIEEQEDLLRKERQREDFEKAKARRKSTAERIAKMRAQMADGRRDSDSAIN